MLRILAMEYGVVWISIGILAFVGCFISGFLIDLRWIGISFMILCILFPMMVAFLYFYHGLKPLTSMNCIPHCFERGEKEVVMTLFPDEEADKKVLVYSLEDFDKWKTGPGYYLLFHKNRNEGFLCVPAGLMFMQVIGE